MGTRLGSRFVGTCFKSPPQMAASACSDKRIYRGAFRECYRVRRMLCREDADMFETWASKGADTPFLSGLSQSPEFSWRLCGGRTADHGPRALA